MAYGNYYGYQQPNYMQSYQNNDLRNQYQPMLPTQMSGTNPDERIWVQGIESARAYLVAPNSFVRLWDAMEQKYYEKSSDSTGRPTLRTFRYEEIIGDPRSQNTNVYDEKIRSIEGRITALENMQKEGVVNVPKSNADDSAV